MLRCEMWIELSTRRPKGAGRLSPHRNKVAMMAGRRANMQSRIPSCKSMLHERAGRWHGTCSIMKDYAGHGIWSWALEA
eukprot:1150796-Pelagomonas_calceolata.AAC.12